MQCYAMPLHGSESYKNNISSVVKQSSINTEHMCACINLWLFMGNNNLSEIIFFFCHGSTLFCIYWYLILKKMLILNLEHVLTTSTQNSQF